MTDETALQVKEKKELEGKEEKTIPGKYYLPYTDIYETADALVVLMEMPGVEKQNIEIKLEKNQLSVEGHIDFERYQNYKPAYTEYNVGHFSRSFTVSSEIDKPNIDAKIADGVLTLRLPKAKEATPRKVEVN